MPLCDLQLSNIRLALIRAVGAVTVGPENRFGNFSHVFIQALHGLSYSWRPTSARDVDNFG